MNNLARIAEVLPRLSDEERRQAERLLRDEYQRRHVTPPYEDAYGVWTAGDQLAVAARVFALLDAEEEAAAKRRSP